MSILPTDPALWPWAAWGWGAVAVFGLMSAVWVLSVVRNDASVVDPFWSLGFLMLTAVVAGVLEDPGPRVWWVVGLVALWALRLASHLAPRILESGEDHRYAAMRERAGSGFELRSLVTIFWLQAGLIVVLAYPLVVAVASPRLLGWPLWAGTAVVLIGTAFEAVADAQLARFRADPQKKGEVLDTGLWRFSRHPNYFGEALLWWGFGIVGSGAAGSPLPLVASAAMTGLLVRVSGIPLLEPHLESTRPGYREYARRTSAFVPWPPARDP